MPQGQFRRQGQLNALREGLHEVKISKICATLTRGRSSGSIPGKNQNQWTVVNQKRKSQLVKVQRTSAVGECSATVEHSYHTHHLPRVQGPSWKKRLKDYKSHRLGRTRARQCLLDMTELWHPGIYSPCDCLHKIQSANILVQSGEALMATSSLGAVDCRWLLGGEHSIGKGRRKSRRASGTKSTTLCLSTTLIPTQSAFGFAQIAFKTTLLSGGSDGFDCAPQFCNCNFSFTCSCVYPVLQMALWVFLVLHVGTRTYNVHMGKQIPMAHSTAGPYVVFTVRRNQGTVG